MNDNIDNTGSEGETNREIIKTTPIIRDLSLNPTCDHGPTILFERGGQRFFACSAYRSRKLCPFYMPYGKWKHQTGNAAMATERDLREGHSGSNKRKLNAEFEKSSKKAKIVGGKMNHPLALPNQRNKGEAQYHFNDATVKFFIEQFRNLGIESILCVGTPSLHQCISSGEEHSDLNSFLLDIDPRFNEIYKDEFSLYNMCNHHFFQRDENYWKFLANSKNLAVVVDPPFGVKVELIWHGCLSGIRQDLRKYRPTDTSTNSEVFWVFPYFMEGHILSKCPEASLSMSDFHVEYRNHPKYSGGSKSKASPIRIFTTVSLTSLILPEEAYRYCDICAKWVDKRNQHCDLCKTCTTKDGGETYVHCKKCHKCVKPTWKHCMKCRICHLANVQSCHPTKRDFINLNESKMVRFNSKCDTKKGNQSKKNWKFRNPNIVKGRKK